MRLRRILAYEHDMGLLVVGNRVIKADTFPMGVGFAMFDTKARDAKVVQRSDERRQTLAGARAVLSIDRLDFVGALRVKARPVAADQRLEASLAVALLDSVDTAE
jgi:trehalose-6-phosphate synthase